MSRTRIICPGCGFVQTYCQCEASNEQDPAISQQPSTKECGLEDENAGETLPDRPLVEHGERDRSPLLTESKYIAAQYPVLVNPNDAL